jgi:hypothetical protein
MHLSYLSAQNFFGMDINPFAVELAKVTMMIALYPEVPGMADYCVYWIRRAHDHLAACSSKNPVAGRAGLVGTQNIRNNQSRVGGLDAVVADSTIVEAVDNQPWSGEANFNVAIVNWVKTKESSMVPSVRRLWFVTRAPTTETADRRGARRGLGASYELNFRSVPFINASLSDKANVSEAASLRCNQLPKQVFQGVTPGHDGFVLTPGEKDSLSRDGVSSSVIHPYLTGRELVTGDGTPERYIIDFQRRSLFEAKAFPAAFDRIEKRVLPDRIRKAEQGKDAAGNVRPHHRGFLDRWWGLSWDRKELFEGLTHLHGRFVACSRVTKHPIFVFLPTNLWPSEQVQAFLFDDDYSFGILQSTLHWQWTLDLFPEKTHSATPMQR